MAIGDTNAALAQSAEIVSDENAAVSDGNIARARAGFARAWRAATDIVLPPLCLGCDTRLSDHDALCPECWRGIDFIRPPICDRLGIPMPYDIGAPMVSATAAAHPPLFDRARAVARYDGLMRDLIHEFKFRDTHDARRLFARWMCQAGDEIIAQCDVILPVPLGRWRLLSRRFNQAHLLADEVARRSQKPLLSRVLKRSRSTPHQVGLTRLQRERNVAGAFRVDGAQLSRIAGRSVLLIDDVMTTGATASASAKVLKAAGAARVDVLVLAVVAETA